MSTVLPTPAPPKRPTLPPRVYGAIRSMTLMPVSKIFGVGSCALNSGAGRWIGHIAAATTGSSLSIVLPSTLKMRPSVPSPTGTVIGPPVCVTRAPRTRPSVEPIARQRTWLLPSSPCTSRIRSRDCIAVPPSSIPSAVCAMPFDAPVAHRRARDQRIVDVRQRLGGELDVDDVPEHLNDFAGGLGGGR